MFPHVSTAVNSTLLGCLRWLEVKVSDVSEKPVEKGPPGTSRWQRSNFGVPIYQTHQNHGTDSMDFHGGFENGHV